MLIWWFYADLKACQRAPDPRRRAQLRALFDRFCGRRTGFAALDRLLVRLRTNKAELLRVLDHPESPWHTNGSENDIRCAARDGFLGLMKTEEKQSAKVASRQGRAKLKLGQEQTFLSMRRLSWQCANIFVRSQPPHYITAIYIANLTLTKHLMT